MGVVVGEGCGHRGGSTGTGWVRDAGIVPWKNPGEGQPWRECSSIPQNVEVEETLLLRQGNKAGLGCAASALP